MGAVYLLETLDDSVSGERVQTGGGLIAEKNTGVVDQLDTNGQTLSLTTRETTGHTRVGGTLNNGQCYRLHAVSSV